MGNLEVLRFLRVTGGPGGLGGQRDPGGLGVFSLFEILIFNIYLQQQQKTPRMGNQNMCEIDKSREVREVREVRDVRDVREVLEVREVREVQEVQEVMKI